MQTLLPSKINAMPHPKVAPAAPSGFNKKNRVQAITHTEGFLRCKAYVKHVTISVTICSLASLTPTRFYRLCGPSIWIS
jgi:hypothetical protein